MKSTGMVRKMDELGRVVLPMELRRVLDIHEKDPLEIFMDGDKVILQKYKANKACAVTGEVTDENRLFGGNTWLSPEGRKILKEELEKEVSKQ